MNLRQSKSSKSWAKITRFTCGWAVIVGLMVGCGRSDQADSSVVDPPAPVDEPIFSSDSDTSRTELSGGIELPAGEIPPPGLDDSSKQRGGIEMPVENEQGGPSTNDGATTTKPEILYATWDEIQTEAQATGKVTVVDLWSLSCEPCLKEFPGLVALHKELGSSIQCIAVDMDYDGRKSGRPNATPTGFAFLASVGAIGFPTYISKTPSDDVFTAMKIPSLPAVLVYGADGMVAKVFVDAGDTAGFSYESDITPLVADLAGK